MNKNTNLILFSISFGALLVLLFTKLEYVLKFGKEYLVRDPKTSPFVSLTYKNGVSHAAEPEALIYGSLMFVLLAGCIFFLIRLLKESADK